MFNLLIISAIKGIERFSYIGLRSILLLYLVNIINLEEVRAQEIYGGYTITCYIFCLLGGYLADNYIGAKYSMLLGSTLVFIGHVCFAFAGQDIFTMVTALSAIALGSAIFKPNAITMVGNICKNSKYRSVYYRFYYLVMNYFVFFAPIITTYFYVYKYEYGFLVAAVAMIFVIIMLLWSWDIYDELSKHDKLENKGQNVVILFILCLVLIYINAYMLYDWYILDMLMKLTMGATGAYIVYFLYCHTEYERKGMFFLIFAMGIDVLFSSFRKQISKVFILFADRNVDMEYTGIIKLSAGILDSIDPFTVMTFGTLSVYLFVNDNIKKIYRNIYLSCVSLIIAFVIMCIGVNFMYNDNYQVSILFPVVSCVFIMFTEILFYPFLIYITNEIAPLKYKSMFMSLLCYGLAISRYVSTIFTKWISSISKSVFIDPNLTENMVRKITLEHYQYVFGIDLLLVIIVTIFLIVILNTHFVHDVVSHYYDKIKNNGKKDVKLGLDDN